MRGLRTDRTAQVIIAAHAFLQNVRRGYYELGLDGPSATRLAAAFTELARSHLTAAGGAPTHPHNGDNATAPAELLEDVLGEVPAPVRVS